MKLQDHHGIWCFTHFIELMNGIVDSEEDVKSLKGKGIIVNHLNSDAEVSKLDEQIYQVDESAILG